VRVFGTLDAMFSCLAWRKYVEISEKCGQKMGNGSGGLCMFRGGSEVVVLTVLTTKSIYKV
jgi:hypothetical protein